MRIITILSSIAIGFIISLSVLNAQEKQVYSNTSTTSEGTVKEVTIVDKQTQKPLSRTIHRLGTCGKMQEKVSYLWNHFSGWTENSKYEYGYDPETGELISISYSKWDNSAKKWTKSKEQAMNNSPAKQNILANQ